MEKIRVGVLFLVLCLGTVLALTEVEKDPRSDQRKLTQCIHKCQTKQDQREITRCVRDCYDTQQQQHGRGQHGQERRFEGGKEEEREHEHSQSQQTSSPYVFHEHHFTEKFRTDQGRISFLEKFSDKSELLKGLENYRLGFLVAEPRTFIVPHHLDADAIFFVVKGTGTITQIKETERGSTQTKENTRKSYTIKAGDVIKLEAGTPVYIVNQDEQQELFIAKLISPVANPGEFEAFFSGGGRNPDSFYTAFSMELLEAALQTKREQLEKLFGQQSQGVIIKASQEQIQALSKEDEEGGVWPFRGSSETKARKPFNLFDQEPTSSNEFGKFFEACPEEFKQLRDINVAVSLTNITQGAMMGPFYNSKSTKIVFVTNGEGYFEMACPHISKADQYQQHGHQSQGRQGETQTTKYQKVTSRLQRNTVFIVPAGHPVAIVASENQNLQVVCFEVNAWNNERFPLAGKNNIINKMQREAKELAFSMSGSDIDKIFNNNDIDELFFPGPGQHRKSRWSIV